MILCTQQRFVLDMTNVFYIILIVESEGIVKTRKLSTDSNVLLKVTAKTFKQRTYISL